MIQPKIAYGALAVTIPPVGREPNITLTAAELDCFAIALKENTPAARYHARKKAR